MVRYDTGFLLSVRDAEVRVPFGAMCEERKKAQTVPTNDPRILPVKGGCDQLSAADSFGNSMLIHDL